MTNIATTPNPAKRHTLDIRFSLPWINRQFYFVILLGLDRRSEKSKASQERRHQSPVLTTIVAVSLILFCIIGGLLLFAGLAYLLKTHAGIDLLKQSSPVPAFLKKIRLCH